MPTFFICHNNGNSNNHSNNPHHGNSNNPSNNPRHGNSNGHSNDQNSICIAYSSLTVIATKLTIATNSIANRDQQNDKLRNVLTFV